MNGIDYTLYPQDILIEYIDEDYFLRKIVSKYKIIASITMSIIDKVINSTKITLGAFVPLGIS